MQRSASDAEGTVLAERPTRTFGIGERSFLLNGEPFVIRCGEIHFPRVPREYWRHRLQMCRALGLNAVCVYLFWNFHEWEEGVYEWSGSADAAEFCRIAQEEGLRVLLRPGPYSCAEWEMGGLPWWLTKYEEIGLRSNDPRYLGPATAFLREVGRVLGPQQITRGGPILMVQVENEYGSFGQDALYMGALRQALIDGGFEVPLFACNPVGDLANGYRSDLFQVVNFGAGAGEEAFARLREFQPTGPLMNGEYYPAWFDMWGRRHRTGPIEPIVSDLESMLAKGRSFSIYMAHGGTSFGLWAGADRPFSPDTTSYDYDAPIDEAGRITPKFGAIREVMARHLASGERLPEPPPENLVVEIPAFSLTEVAPLFDNLPSALFDDEPRTMEAYGQSRGTIVYRTTLPTGSAATLAAGGVHDFAWAFLDGEPVGVMDRRNGRFRLDLPDREAPTRLDLLIYAMGRVNFGQEVFDRKGLQGPVTLDGEPLRGWEIASLPLDRSTLEGLRFATATERGPAFWRGSFDLDLPGDTFLDVRSWGKGVVWINGHCLGRYWNIGPTQTLYVPGPWLRAGRNEVIVLDLLGPSAPTLAGLGSPVLDELRPGLDFSRPPRATGRFEPGEPVTLGTLDALGGRQTFLFDRAIPGRYLCVEIDALADLDAVDSEGRSIPRAGWKVLWASGEETQRLSGEAENAIDGQTSTAWHAAGDRPHRLAIDLGEVHVLGGVRLLSPPGERGRVPFNLYLSDHPFGLEPAE